jgi:hypothetical protein
MKMDSAMKARWVAALRSGEYQQADGCLRTADRRYCCLGVLCEISGDGAWEEDGTVSYYNVAGQPSNSHLPSEMNRKCGITTGQEAELVRLNDGGKSFGEIADHIEENL